MAECPLLVREPFPTGFNSQQNDHGITAVVLGLNWGGLVALPG
jgi:hypothetical protein